MSSIDTSASRASILNKLGATLGTGKDRAAREKVVRDHLKRHTRNLVPERGNVDGAARIALFREQAEAVAASVTEVKSTDDVPEEITAYLRKRNLPARLKHGGDPLLAGLPWDKAPTLERDSGVANGDDAVSLSRAYSAVAETGTLILVSGADNPTTLNFLPEHHIVVARRKATVGRRLRGCLGPHARGLWRGARPAAHRQHDLRAVAHRGRGTDHPARRPRAAQRCTSSSSTSMLERGRLRT